VRLLAATALAAALACCPAAAAERETVSLEIDAERVTGKTNPNLVGLGTHGTEGAAQLRPLRAGTVRIDADIAGLVRCPDGALRPGRMRDLQRKLDYAESIGRQTILILSYMPPCLAATRPGDPRDPTRLPPADPQRWQELITEIVTATGPGRAATAGRRPVRYYEVWNEPDLPIFWQDTIASFASGVMVPSGRAVAAVEAASGLDLRFGICACFVPDPAWLVPLMGDARAAGIPVDFLSWHYYANYPFIGPDGAEAGAPAFTYPFLDLIRGHNPLLTPQVYAGQIEMVAALARATLGRVPELVIDEWNISAAGFDHRHDTHEGAAFQAAALAVFAEAGLDRAALFKNVDDDIEADAAGNPLARRYGGWGLLDRSLRRKPAWFAQRWFRSVGPRRLASPQFAAEGVWTAAGAGKRAVEVLVSSFEASGGADRRLALRVAGLEPGAHLIELHRIDKRHRGSTEPLRSFKAGAGASGEISLELALPAQSVLLVWIRP
jgi:hypothetical protein